MGYREMVSTLEKETDHGGDNWNECILESTSESILMHGDRYGHMCMVYMVYMVYVHIGYVLIWCMRVM